MYFLRTLDEPHDSCFFLSIPTQGTIIPVMQLIKKIADSCPMHWISSGPHYFSAPNAGHGTPPSHFDSNLQRPSRGSTYSWVCKTIILEHNLFSIFIFFYLLFILSYFYTIILDAVSAPQQTLETPIF